MSSKKNKQTVYRKFEKQLLNRTSRTLYTSFVDCGTVQPGTTLQAASHKSGSAQLTKQVPQVYGTEEQQSISDWTKNWPPLTHRANWGIFILNECGTSPGG